MPVLFASKQCPLYGVSRVKNRLMAFVCCCRYPFEPPKLRFLTPIYHPNIDNAGRICHDALKMPPAGAWNPAHNVSNLLTTIRFLIAEPNADDGLMPDITQLYTTDRPTFISIAKQHTLKHATSSVRRASSAGPALSARASNSHTSDVSSGTQQPSSAALASQVEPPAAEDAPLKRSAPINNTDVGGVSKKSREGEVSSVEDVDAEVELPPSSKVSTDDRSNEEQGGDDSDIEIIYVTRRHNQDC